jgi:hypothetical protein
MGSLVEYLKMKARIIGWLEKALDSTLREGSLNQSFLCGFVANGRWSNIKSAYAGAA